MLELLFVQPGLVRLHQLQHFKRLHVAAIVLIEDLEHLLELEERHVDLLFLLVVPIDKRFDFLGQLEGALLLDTFFTVLFLIFSENAEQEIISLLLKFVYRSINFLLVIRIEDSQEQIHEHE